MAASKQQEARSTYTSAYPMEIANGGVGVVIQAESTSQRAAFVGRGNTMVFSNEATVSVYVAWGDSTVVATTSHYRVMPGAEAILTFDEDEEDPPTHFAVITVTGTGRVLGHLCYGS